MSLMTQLHRSKRDCWCAYGCTFPDRDTKHTKSSLNSYGELFNGTTYTYLSNEEYEVGDLVLVNTKRNPFFGVAKVMYPIDYDEAIEDERVESLETGHILGKVSFSETFLEKALEA